MCNLCMSFWFDKKRLAVDETATAAKSGKKKRPLEARCYSGPCNEHKSGYKIKHVSKTKNFCPDCGHALFWIEEGGRSVW